MTMGFVRSKVVNGARIISATISYDFSYSESVEIHRIDEAAATPFEEGAHLSECFSNNKRI